VIITRSAEYFEKYLPSPRHRIFRMREVPGTVVAEIREVTLAQAPVGIRETNSSSFLNVLPDHGLRHRVDYHWFEGKFYTTCRRGRAAKRVADIHWQYYYYGHGLAEYQANFTVAMSRYLIIDGKLCVEIGEPRYVCMTFGMGHNHGGTALMVEHGYNTNIVTEAYFSVLEEAEAREAVLSVAAGRGDTKSLPGLRRRQYHHFEVLIPESVTVDRETRTGTVNEFSAKLNTIANSGMPNALTGVVAMMAACANVSSAKKC
jgi:hypothetical protein